MNHPSETVRRVLKISARPTRRGVRADCGMGREALVNVRCGRFTPAERDVFDLRHRVDSNFTALSKRCQPVPAAVTEIFAES